MLVLTREINESIMIGDDIEVTLSGIYMGDEARINIHAPKKTPVHRKEIYDKILKNGDKRAKNNISKQFEDSHDATEYGTLSLGRKKSEAIMIGNDIKITITGFKGDRVLIGIQAPKTVKILRKELCGEIKRQEAAAPSDPSNE